jgi:HAD superfamily hydrolase (TIGR01509 family)
MDGLMLDTERPAVSLWLRAAAEHGWRIEEAVPLSTVGLNEADTRRRVLDACGDSFPYEAVRRRMGELYDGLMEEPGPEHRPGLLSLLDALDRLGVPLAVATSTDRDAALRKLGKAGILGRFSAVACGDEVAKGKPEPDIFLLAASRLGAEPRSCVGFEDSPAGLKALSAAGIRSVFVKDLVEPPPEVLAGVWRRCGDLAEAAALFV